MKYLILITMILTKVCWTFAAIPSLSFVLQKSAATTGRQILQIEQDVIFKIGPEEAVVSETWLIEGDRNLKLLATGKGLYKQNVHLQAVYNNKLKTSLFQKNKQTVGITTDFFQKYLFIRSAKSFEGYLSELGIPAIHRLSRADGRPVFALGEPSSIELSNPQIWIDQDDFVIRKIRLPSLTEVEFSQIHSVDKNTSIAKLQVVKWGPYQVIIKIKSITAKPGLNISTFTPQSLDQNSEIFFANKTPLTDVIEQFYQRYR